jgi:hypothetical protein
MSRADDLFDMNEWLGSHSQNFYKIMIVEFNSGGSSYIPIQQASTRQANTAGASSDSSVSFSTQSLQDSIKQSSQVDASKVAQANALLSDSNYPSDKALNQLAGFLASRIQS